MTFLEKMAADLTAAARDRVKTKNFALPEERRYPIHDESHARAALSMVAAHGSPGEKAQVHAAVAQKYPALAARSESIEKEAEKIVKERRKSMTASQARAGRRPMRVETMLRKENEGTLWKEAFASFVQELSKEARVPWIASEAAEHATDLGGLGLMAMGSLDKLQTQLRGKDENKGSLMGGDTGRSSADLAGLAMMAAPSLAALRHKGPGLAGGGSKFTNVMNALSLGALAAPVADRIQARMRAQPGEDASSKQLLSDGTHHALELGGLAGLSVPVARNLARGDISRGAGASLLGGYATLAAPAIDEMQAHARSAPGEDPHQKMLIGNGAGKSMTELAGLGMLAAPSLLAKHGASKQAYSLQDAQALMTGTPTQRLLFDKYMATEPEHFRPQDFPGAQHAAFHNPDRHAIRRAHLENVLVPSMSERVGAEVRQEMQLPRGTVINPNVRHMNPDGTIHLDADVPKPPPAAAPAVAAAPVPEPAVKAPARSVPPPRPMKSPSAAPPPLPARPAVAAAPSAAPRLIPRKTPPGGNPLDVLKGLAVNSAGELAHAPPRPRMIPSALGQAAKGVVAHL